MTEPCSICDFIGPREFEGETLAAWVEVHREVHTLGRIIANELIYPWLIPLIYRLNRLVTKGKP